MPDPPARRNTPALPGPGTGRGHQNWSGISDRIIKQARGGQQLYVLDRAGLNVTLLGGQRLYLALHKTGDASRKVAMLGSKERNLFDKSVHRHSVSDEY